MIPGVGRVGGIGRSATRSGGGGGPVPEPTNPNPAPNYLATVSSAPYAAFGGQRVVSGYAGPLVQLRRTSDDATQDFSCPSGSDYLDYAAINTWAGGSELRVTTWHDQSGNGRHLTQATASLQPVFDAESAFGNPTIPVVFNSNAATGFNAAGTYLQATGWAVDRIARSIFYGAHSSATWENRAVNTFRIAGATVDDSYSGSGRFGTVYDPGGGGVVFNSPTIAQVGYAPRISPQARGHVSGPTSGVYYINGTSNTASRTTMSSVVADEFRLGRTSTQFNTSPADLALYSMVIYPAVLNSTDANAVVSSINTAHAFSVGAFDYGVVFDGDSIARGNTMTGLVNAPNSVMENLTKRARAFNTGVAGQGIEASYTSRVARFAGAYLSGVPNVFFVQGGTNSMTPTLGDATVTGSGAYVYANSTSPLVTYLKGLGYLVVVCTLPPRSDRSANQETNAQQYNAAVRANTAGADYVLDFDAHPLMGGTATSTYYTEEAGKLIHPNSLGYRHLAGAPTGTYANQHTYYYALREVLRTALADAGYVP